VGVVKDARAFRLREAAWLYYYEPLVEEDPRAGALLVRLTPGATRVGDALRRALAERDPALPFVRIESLAEALEPQIRPFRLGAAVFTVFGTIAMLLAALGLYSSLAYGVAQRTRELGVRIAIGAATRDVVALVLNDGLRIAFVGLVGGLGIAIVAARWFGELLFDVSPRDPFVLAMVASGIMVVAILASLVPAGRAANVAPMEALRAD
jgi:ABC-type antimicrobial peptide transport system permease subunit